MPPRFPSPSLVCKLRLPFFFFTIPVSMFLSVSPPLLSSGSVHFFFSLICAFFQVFSFFFSQFPLFRPLCAYLVCALFARLRGFFFFDFPSSFFCECTLVNRSLYFFFFGFLVSPVSFIVTPFFCLSAL